MVEQAVHLPEPLRRVGVSVWQIALDAPGAPQAAIDASADVLGAQEFQRWQAFRCPQAATAFVLLRASLARLLRSHFGVDMRGRSMACGPHGKPALPAGGPPWFNLSHSGSRGCIALSERCEIGIDIERHGAAAPTLPHGVFTARECAHIRRAGVPGFYRIWTRKEAVLKALGLGFAADARAVCVAPPAGDDERAGMPCATTQLWSIDSIAGCSVAVACVRPQG
ncbi:4'-phosphopantetheinyl transferase family protein [Variovorax sp. LARHSF232]